MSDQAACPGYLFFFDCQLAAGHGGAHVARARGSNSGRDRPNGPVVDFEVTWRRVP